MAISTPPTVLDTRVSASNLTSFASNSFTPTAGALLIVILSTVGSQTSNDPDVTSCTCSHAGSWTWTEQVNPKQRATGRNELSIWTATVPASPGSGTVTVTWTNVTSRTVMFVLQVTGHNASAPITQVKSGTGTASTLSLTLDSTPAAGSTVIGAVSAYGTAALSITPSGTGYTELTETNSAGSSVQDYAEICYDSADAGTGVSWSGLGTINNVAAAIEIAAAASAVSINLATATLTASGQALTVSAGAAGITVNLQTAALTAQGQALDVIPGPVSIALQTATLTAAGQAITPGYTYRDGYGGDVNTAQDTMLVNVAGGGVTENYGVHDAMRFTTSQYISLIRFNLSAIPAGSTCIRARLHLFKRDLDYVQVGRVGIHSVAAGNAGWVEGAGDGDLAAAGESCWNALAADGSGGVTTPWAGSAGAGTSGTDYESAEIGYFTTTASDVVGTEYIAELDADRIAGWFGTSNTNYGLRLEVTSGNAGRVCAAEHPTTAYRPYLELVYQPAAVSNITITLDTASLTASAQALDVVPGAVSIALATATLAAQAQAADIVPGPAVIALATATLAAQPQPLDVQPGAAVIELATAALAATGQAASVIAPPPGVSVHLATATLTAQGQTLEVLPGAAVVQLSTAALQATGQAASVELGALPAVVVNLATATLSMSGQGLSVIPGAVAVNLQTAILAAIALALSVSGGAHEVAKTRRHRRHPGAEYNQVNGQASGARIYNNLRGRKR